MIRADDGRRHVDDSPAWWAEQPDAVLRTLGTSAARGLSEQDARQRLRQYGPNRLHQAPSRSSWRMLWDQFASLIVGLLVAAAAVAFVFDEKVEGFAILAVIFINAGMGFVTERRATRSMEALRELGHIEASVRRDGSVRVVPASALVPGDIVVLDAGDVLAADVRLLSGSRLQADESALTGESLPVDKGVEPVAVEAPLMERASMLWKGTAVTLGSAEGIVVATGMTTELGRISSLVEAAEPDSTPLEKRLDRLSRRLVVLTLAVAALVAVAFAASGRSVYVAVEIAIALAVATIPEGLPIVATVALARGMWRMAKRNALVERLAAVETLGSTTVILTDKTGTLTENRMTAVELRLDAGRIQVEGTGLEPTGSFRLDGEKVVVAEHPDLLEALGVGVLCNNATIGRSEDGAISTTGDPTEVALLIAGAKAGLDRSQLLERSPEVRELAFDPSTQRMATLHEAAGSSFAAVKGAPEVILEACVSVRTHRGRGRNRGLPRRRFAPIRKASAALPAGVIRPPKRRVPRRFSGLLTQGNTRPLAGHDRAAWSEQADQMAASGQRVLALATAPIGSLDAFQFEGLILLGLVGISDPPRERVRAAIDACQDAGIRMVMVTGDHGATAWSVAAAVGLIDPEPGDPFAAVDCRTLADFDQLQPGEIQSLLQAPVIARATPRQKLQLIELHQRDGAVVAMTGDGVNDAPALKRADIGIAMGLRGTQVAREAADMVLQDDELGTIVTAVAQGRAILANIRKFVIYLMSCNVSEILAVGIAALVRGPLPILPLQILFLNLVTDVFPALALGVSEGSPALMRQPPRDPREPLLSGRDWRGIFALGAVIAACVLAALGLSVLWLGKTASEATSVAFLTLAMAQLWHVFSMRDAGSGRLRNEITTNPWIWAALGLCVVLLLLAVYWPPLATVLSIADPGRSGWSLAITASLVPLLVGQTMLAVRRRREPSAGSALA